MSEYDKFDYTRVLTLFSAALCADGEIPKRVRDLRLSALHELHGYLAHYEKRGYIPSLIHKIAESKCPMIMKATSKAEVQMILKPQCPHYDGVKFIPNAYHVPEEELIWWSETSLSAPLNEIGFKRYAELFCEVFPEKSIMEEVLH